MNTPNSITPTAIRTWNRSGSKATVAVTCPDGFTVTAGGDRANRAAAAVIVRRADGWKLHGLRADLSAAETEATRLRTATSTRAGRKHLALPITPAEDAMAVPVTDAPAEEKAPRKSRKAAGPSNAEINEAVETLAAEVRAAGGTAEVTPLPTETPKRKSVPNAERRNEVTHPDGAAAVAAHGCPTCKARKGALCIARSGERTNHVHAGRMARMAVAS